MGRQPGGPAGPAGAPRAGLEPALYRKARDLAAIAAELSPENADVLTVLGAAQLRCGESEAAATLERAIAMSGRFPVRQNALLAMALHQAGRTTEARTVLERTHELMAAPLNAMDRENRLLVQEALTRVSR